MADPTWPKALKVGLGAQNILLAASVYFTKGLNVGLDYNEIQKNVDILVLGTHDLLRSDQSSDLPSPLYGATPNDPSWDSAVNTVLDVTHSTQHVVASLSFSGAQFLLRSQPQTDREMATSGLPASRVTGGGHYTRINGTLSFFEICLLFHSEPWKHAVSKDASCPILNRGTNWIGYDNAWSIRQKVVYALRRNLAGIAVRRMEMDDWRGVCGDYTYPLMKTVQSQMQSCRVT